MYFFKSKARALIVFLFLPFVYALAQNAEDLDSTIATWHMDAVGYYSYHEESFVETMAKIDSINEFNTSSRKAFYDTLVYSLNHIKKGNFDSSLQICFHELYNNKDIHQGDSIILYRQIAHIYYEFGGYKTAKYYLLKIHDMMDVPSYEVASVSTNLAKVFYETSQPDSGIFYLKEALYGHDIEKLGHYINLGAFHFFNDEIDSSYRYYQLAWRNSESKTREETNYIYLGLGNCYKEWENYDSAKHYYRKIIADSVLLINWFPYVNANTNLVDIFQELEQTDSSLLYLENFFLCPCLPNLTLAHLNTIKASFYLDINDTENYIFYLNEIIKNHEDHIVDISENMNQLSELNVSILGIIKENLELKNENLAVSEEKNFVFVVLIVVLLVFFLLCGVIFWFWTKKRKQLFEIKEQLNQSKIESLKAKGEQLKFELKHKNYDLAQLTRHILIKSDFVKDYKTRLKEIMNLPVDEVSQNLKQFLLELNAMEQLNSQLDTLHSNINEVNSELVSRLKGKFPRLSENEIQICLLHLLKLSTKDIAALRNVTPKAIQVARYRIKKKMNLSEEDNFIEFLENLTVS